MEVPVMKRAVLLAAALAAVFAPAALAKAKLPTHTFVVITQADSIDTGAPGDSAGDMSTFAFQVFDRRGGKRLGSGHGYCVRTEVGRANTCTSNTSLPG